MLPKALQGASQGACAILICLSTALLAADAPPAPATRPAAGAAAQETRAQLAAECKRLIALSVKKPYGIGWGKPGELGPDKKPTRYEIDNSALQTPAAGLVLHWAGLALEDPKLTKAALDVARGLVFGQDRTGRIGALVAFGQRAFPIDSSAPPADRAPSRAALALFMAIAEGQKDPNPQVAAGAKRALTWLRQQQPSSGGWPGVDPPDAPAENQAHIFQLNSSDFRDNTLAMMFAFEVYGDNLLRVQAERSCEALLRLRFTDSRTVNGIWPAATTMSGEASPIGDLAAGVSIIATRHAMQTTLAMHLLTGEPTSLAAFDLAAKTLATLPRDNGKLRHNYPTNKSELRKTPEGVKKGPEEPARHGGGAFAPAGDVEQEDDEQAINRLVALREEMKHRGRIACQDRISEFLPLHEQWCALLAGLETEWRPFDLPADAAEAKALAAKLADLPTGGDVPSRVRRIYTLLLRLKAEKMAAQPMRPAP